MSLQDLAQAPTYYCSYYQQESHYTISEFKDKDAFNTITNNFIFN